MSVGGGGTWTRVGWNCLGRRQSGAQRFTFVVLGMEAGVVAQVAPTIAVVIVWAQALVGGWGQARREAYYSPWLMA